MNNLLFSREKAAGYDPTVLSNAIVLIVGTGALGQIVAMILALGMVGTLLLVDLDKWELHNATRSPFFPNGEERDRWGIYKSPQVAHKLRRMISWSSKPKIYYATKPIQALGDAPFRMATVVVSCVDNQVGRNYLGFKTAQHGMPLVEGGFSGSRMNGTILLNDRPDAPCWHCNIYDHRNRNRSIQLGCTKAAKLAEESGFEPAIQSAASCLGAFLSEATIQLLHGNNKLGNRQIFLDIRAATSSVMELQFNHRCQRHPSQSKPEFSIKMPLEDSCRALLAELGKHLANPVVRLPFNFLVRVGCAQCKHPILVNQPDWGMTELLFCKECGGKWDRIDKPGNEIYPTLSSQTESLLDLPIEKLGFTPRSRYEAKNDDHEITFELEGDTKLPFFTFTNIQENHDAL